jgi:hypothetical protein
MTGPNQPLRADAALEALLDAVKSPAPSPALWRRLTGPGALAALQRHARIAPRRSLVERLAWLVRRPSGYALASVLGLVIGYGAADLMTADAPGPNATLAVVEPTGAAGADTAAVASAWGADEMGFSFAPETAAWSAAVDDEAQENDSAVPLI